MAKTNTAPAQNQNKPSAKPGTPDDAAKKQKKNRAQYPIPEGGLESVPTDFDSKKFKPLKKKDFKSEATFLELRADNMEAAAKRLREEAAAIRAGGGKDKGKAKKLVNMTRKLAEMKAAMEAEGIDVEALIQAALAENAAKKTEAPADAAKA